MAEVEAMQRIWASLREYVDAERFDKTASLLEVQRREAQWWRDACIAYFQRISALPLPAGAVPPAFSLEHYQSLRIPATAR